MSHYSPQDPETYAESMEHLRRLRESIPSAAGSGGHEIDERPNRVTGLHYGELVLHVDREVEAAVATRAMLTALDIGARITISPGYLDPRETRIELEVCREIEPGSRARADARRDRERGHRRAS